jgi:hypothetical protein
MADNTSQNATSTIATDEIGGVHYQIVKLTYGALDSSTLVSPANPLPVTGTFWQATQPVSIASMPSTPVTGTFWQATQPVSGPLTDAQLRAAVVPVSLASLPALTAGAAIIGAVTQSGTWNIGSVTTLPALVAGSALIGKVGIDQTTPGTTNAVVATGPTLTKATQGATGFSVQKLNDAGRAIVNAATAIAGVTAVTTEALLALNVSRDGAATASATTIAVTSGKRLRIIGVTASIISTAAAVISARISLRLNPSGAAAATSPILVTLSLTQQAAALAQAGDTCVIMFPEAIEISGTMQVGLSQVASVVTGTIWASLIAYEY